jgi:glycosyltransferase involved in cell wall biosynthesis
MLSILIPTYGEDIVFLVETLRKQALKLNISFEIISYDNGSKSDTDFKNNTINSFQYCSFKALENNGGRSKIRNLLAQNAKYDWLLFLDADVIPVTNNFISNYVQTTQNTEAKVVFGGLKYYDEKPSNNKMLRWTYGKSREEISLEIRNRNPDIHFTSANFMISNAVFKKYNFDEDLTKYGYEDTLLAKVFQQNNIFIHQIDNPVFHLGLDENKVFLEKTKRAVENMNYLYQNKKISSKGNKLLGSLDKSKKFKLNKGISFIFAALSGSMERNLVSAKPSLIIYDLYKLGYLCRIN